MKIFKYIAIILFNSPMTWEIKLRKLKHQFEDEEAFRKKTYITRNFSNLVS